MLRLTTTLMLRSIGVGPSILRDGEGFNWVAEVEPSEVDDDSSHTWSVEDSPPVTDDARRGRPAVNDHHAQGGLPEAKLHVGDGGSQSRNLHLHATGKTTLPASTAASRFEAAELALSYLPDVVQRACENFEKLRRLDQGVACA